MKNKKHFKYLLVAAAISLVFGVGVFCLTFFLQGRGLGPASNGSIYAAVILISTAAFIYISRCGFFDFVSYGFKQLGSQLFKKNPNEFNDYPSYREQKNASRSGRSKYYLGILFVGLLFLIASFVFLALI